MEKRRSFKVLVSDNTHLCGEYNDGVHHLRCCLPPADHLQRTVTKQGLLNRRLYGLWVKGIVMAEYLGRFLTKLI